VVVVVYVVLSLTEVVIGSVSPNQQPPKPHPFTQYRSCSADVFDTSENPAGYLDFYTLIVDGKLVAHRLDVTDAVNTKIIIFDSKTNGSLEVVMDRESDNPSTRCTIRDNQHYDPDEDFPHIVFNNTQPFQTSKGPRLAQRWDDVFWTWYFDAFTQEPIQVLVRQRELWNFTKCDSFTPDDHNQPNFKDLFQLSWQDLGIDCKRSQSVDGHHLSAHFHTLDDGEVKESH